MKVEIEELRAWVDDELDAATASKVAALVEHDPQLQELADHMRQSQLPYREAFEQRPTPTVPTALRRQVESIRHTDNSTKNKNRMPFALALTGMLTTLLAGYLFGSYNKSESALATTSIAIEDLGFASAVASYQALYSRETVADVKDNNLSALNERLSKNSWLSIQAPDFEQQGYRFIRAQQLAFAGNPLIQLIYLRSDGLPLALCFMADAGAEFALDINTHFGMSTAEWLNSNTRFVMVSDANKEHLTELYEAVIAQWQG